MKNKVELLSPCGDFECVKAAVQNGADAIYVGASSFSARASAANFDLKELEAVINYAHVRNVKVHLALNTLIKNNEFSEALSLAQKAYELGIDAIIVQDIGLAATLISTFPKLPIHASTQMTIHNLDGVKTCENLGFERVVLSRELTLEEISYICRNTKLEIETFIHGALCISYSGQCLFSSMVGGRSANRGKCAQACRLPYQLLENNKIIDNGYLLSPRDLCGLDFLPSLIEAGVKSFKIEGRLKSPEYVATVTRIYRKYIDLYFSSKPYTVELKDRKDLLQVFNRGNFSCGHLDKEPNLDLVFKEKQNNMGIYIGNVSNYDGKKGHVTLNLNDALALGDSVTFENEPTKYRVSELMFQDKNIPFACDNELITIGRMKGNISPGDKIFKISSKALSDDAKITFSGKELKKIKLNCKIAIKKDTPISVFIKPDREYENYKNVSVSMESNIIPVEAVNQPISKERIISQFSKTTDTPYEFASIDVDLDDNLYIPKISEINALRRDALAKLESLVCLKFTRVPTEVKEKNFKEKKHSNPKISLLFKELDSSYDYSLVDNVDRAYIPLKYFGRAEFKHCVDAITSKFKTYIYMPPIVTANYANIVALNINKALSSYNIAGFVISNTSSLYNIKKDEYKNYEFISNYSMNVYNDYTISELARLGVDCVTLSSELNKTDIQNIHSPIDKELTVYGRARLMITKYCLLGSSNSCYPKCDMKCKSGNKYYLKDRMGFLFRIIPDNLKTITSIYNSKILSIEYGDLNIDYARIDVLEESIDEINNVIRTVKVGKRFEGSNYTNGHLNRDV